MSTQRKPGASPSPGESGAPASTATQPQEAPARRTPQPQRGNSTPDALKPTYGQGVPNSVSSMSAQEQTRATDPVSRPPMHIRNTLDVMRGYAPDLYMALVAQRMQEKNLPNLAARKEIANEYAGALQQAIRADGYPVQALNDITQRDVTDTLVKVALARKAKVNKDLVASGQIPADTMSNDARSSVDRAATIAEVAKDLPLFKDSYKFAFAQDMQDPQGPELPQDYTQQPQPAQPTAQPQQGPSNGVPPSEEGPAAQRKRELMSGVEKWRKSKAGAQDALEPGMGDLKRADAPADDLGKRLRDGVKAWNSSKQTEEEVE